MKDASQYDQWEAWVQAHPALTILFVLLFLYAIGFFDRRSSKKDD